ncbi:MAG: formate hydrogenlyase subunit 3/multisubunit Na+/H+ antiporter MnhD subunit [Candidatus Azotimanducaceae bacterium]
MRISLALLGLITLAIGLLAPAFSTTFAWLLLGTTFNLDEINRPILLATGTAWVIAALMSGSELSNRVKLALTGVVLGNALVLASGDYISLYCGFAIMSLSAYGLFGQQRAERQASFVYIVYAMIAELILFAGMLMLASRGDPGAAIPLCVSLAVVVGFGVKAGMIPVHGTLPLTYRHVPLTAGIVLAGAAINTGILGWLRWLTDVSIEDGAAFGQVISILGIVAYLYAIILALGQRHARAILGYSSVSQVALIMVVLGVGLADQVTRSDWFAGIALMALFHALAKTGLFAASLGYPADRLAKSLWWATVIVAALSLAGATFTAGYLAKITLTQATDLQFDVVSDWLWLSSVLTTLVVAWFVVRVRSAVTVDYSASQTWGLALALLSLVILCVWAVLAQSHSLVGILLSLVPVLFAASLGGWLGKQRSDTDAVATGDVSTFAVQVGSRGASWLFDLVKGLSVKSLVPKSMTKKP